MCGRLLLPHTSKYFSDYRYQIQTTELEDINHWDSKQKCPINRFNEMSEIYQACTKGLSTWMNNDL